MSDYKGGYSTNASKMKNKSESSKTFNSIRKSAESRSNTWRNTWKKVNLNDIVNEFAPDAIPFNNGGKFIYNGKRYTVLADTYGGYLRIKDKTIPGNKNYITLDGKSYYNLPKAKREQLTHFYILKREEM